MVILIQAPFFYNYYKNENKEYPLNLNLYDFTKGFDEEMYFFRAVGVICLGYFMHIGAMPIQKGLENNVQRRSLKMFGRATFIECFLYLIVASSGFFTMLSIDDVELIFLRDNLILKPDAFIMIAESMIVISLTISTAGNYIGMREILANRVFDTKHLSNAKNVAITGAVYALTTTFAILKSDILGFLGFAGGFFGITLMLIIPGLLFMVSLPERAKNPKNIAILAIFGVVIAFGLVGAIKCLYKLF